MVADIFKSIEKNENPVPNFYDGVRCQEVLDAVDASIKKRGWVKVKK